MITTLFFLLLIAFELCYVTSKQTKINKPAKYLRKIIANPKSARIVAALIFVLSTVLFIIQLGWVSGLIACLVCLMGAGNLVVTLHPFRYLRGPAIMGLFFFFLILEFII
nr:hypothetical protein [Mucilaginibacter sp. L294]